MIWGRRKAQRETHEQQSQPLSGMIDLHAHLLLGKDDGAADVAEVAQILTTAREAGFLLVTATPHLMAQGSLVGRKDTLEAFEQLKGDPALAGLGAMLVPGAENYMDEAFFDNLERGDLLPLGGVGRRHLLVEVPMVGMPPFMAQAAFRIRVKGWVPLLAHPERYVAVIERPGLLYELREMGYMLQGNLSSLAGIHGRSVKRTLEQCLAEGLIDCLASDVHTARRAETIYGRGIARCCELLGRDQALRLLKTVPSQILEE
ncbi:MAG: CpsB/CapC family capsule biosynthesis tyrosine phosphatase [Candidatus Alcyoniella australis]|nr:CpsB/CapC family capsule biosynthesis tyrosine phosphatase [Candidatus Alcyoniella australis]